MSWWGKIIGGAFGYMLGGPLGALLGSALGHQYDTAAMRAGATDDAGVRERAQTAFFTAAFSVMGHLCKTDGRVSEHEIELARAVMDRMALRAEQRRLAMDLFREGKRRDFPLERVLAQLRDECHRDRSLLTLFMEIQLSAALADGALQPNEDTMLRRVCAALGLPVYEYEQLVAMARVSAGRTETEHRGPALSLEDSYAILGVRSTAADREVRHAYRRLLSQHHPDKLAAKGLPEEMMRIATEKTQEIRRAYERILAVRNST
ncbi:MAG: co-chaperone DjlA [Chromatiales bacterium]